MNAFVVRKPGEGDAIGGGRNLIKLRSEDANGSFALLENTLAPGRNIPSHMHGQEEEAWYVVEGELTFVIDGETVVAPVGTFVMVPRGMAHGFANRGDVPAKVLEIFAPGGMERYFEEREALARQGNGNGDYAGLDETTHAELAARYHMKFVDR